MYLLESGSFDPPRNAPQLRCHRLHVLLPALMIQDLGLRVWGVGCGV